MKKFIIAMIAVMSLSVFAIADEAANMEKPAQTHEESKTVVKKKKEATHGKKKGAHHEETKTEQHHEEAAH